MSRQVTLIGLSLLIAVGAVLAALHVQQPYALLTRTETENTTNTPYYPLPQANREPSTDTEIAPVNGFIDDQVVVSPDSNVVVLRGVQWVAAESYPGLKMYERKDGAYVHTKTTKNFYYSWLDAVVLADRYLAYTYYPGRGPGGATLALYDLTQGEHVELNDIFPELLPAAARWSIEEMLPPQHVGGVLLLVTRSEHYPPMIFSEEPRAQPGNEIVLLDFDTLSMQHIAPVPPTSSLLPIAMSNDGRYTLLQRTNFVLTTTADEQRDCERAEEPCIKCLVAYGFLVVDNVTTHTLEFATEKVLRAWMQQTTTTFMDLEEPHHRWIEERYCYPPFDHGSY